MSESHQTESGRLQSLSYPLAFLLIAGCLGFLTYKVVTRLAAETATEKLRAIVGTSTAAFDIWSSEHQSIVEFIAASEQLRSVAKPPEIAAPLAAGAHTQRRESFPSGESRLTHEQELAFDAALRPVMEQFGYSGAALVSADGSISYVRGIRSDALGIISRRIGKQPQTKAVLIPPLQPIHFDPSPGHENGYQAAAGTPSESLALFTAPVVDSAGKPFAYLTLQLPSSAGLDTLLASASVGDSGETFLIDPHGQRLTSTSGFDLATSQSRFDQQVLSSLFRPARTGRAADDGDMTGSGADVAVLLSGFVDRRGEPLVGACARVKLFDVALVTLIERGEVFAATVALQRILLAMLGLALIAAGMNWAYVVRLSRLRSRMSAAKAKIRTLGQYNLEEKIGEGGMGIVYRASHSLLQRPTAVKLILPNRASDRTIKNFEREVILTSRLTHPNTIAIYDYGRTEEGTFYYAMEYLDGTDLASLIEAEGPQPWPRVVHILAQVCDSLGEAHANGLIHRDIKPENVMLCRRGNRHDVVKVLDFGLAGDFSEPEALQSLCVQGTPAYMAPESIMRPDEIDARVDVYAVGALGYFLLSGRHAFNGETIQAILQQQLNSRPIPLSQRRPELPDGLQRLIMECMSKEASERPFPIESLRARLLALSTEIWTEEDARTDWKKMQQARSECSDSNERPTGALRRKTIAKTIDFSQPV